jgi:hypothetical protein
MGLYRDWLARRYPGAGALAKSWKRPGLELRQVTEPAFDHASLMETLDAFSFMSDMILESFRDLRSACDDAGLVGVPYYTNSKNMMQFLDWREIEAETLDCHSCGLFLPNMWPGDQKLSVSWFLRIFRARTNLCWAGEFQGGTADGRVEVYGFLTPEHNRFSSLMAMALGLRGLCYYMYVDRDNSLFSPISPLGQVRPRITAFSDATRVLKELRPDTHIAQLGLLWSLQHHRCFVATRFGDWTSLAKIGSTFAEPKELAPWWDVFRRLHDVDADFGIAPLDQDLSAYRSLIYAGPDFAARTEMDALYAWVVGGGKLLAVTALPTRTAEGEDISDVTAKIGAHANVTLRTWGGWHAHLEDLSAWSGLRAQAPGFWTAAYRDPQGISIFISNIGEASGVASVQLDSALAKEIAGRTAQNAMSGESWKVSGNTLWSGHAPVFAPNVVTCIRIKTTS